MGRIYFLTYLLLTDDRNNFQRDLNYGTASSSDGSRRPCDINTGVNIYAQKMHSSNLDQGSFLI